MTPRWLWFALSLVLAIPAASNAECVTINTLGGAPYEPPPPPPPRVFESSGAVCGALFVGGESGLPIQPAIDGDDIWLYRADGNDVVAKAGVFGGKFQLPHLPRGEYRLGMLGFEKTAELITVGDGDQIACQRSLYVLLHLVGECRTPSRISDKPFTSEKPQ